VAKTKLNQSVEGEELTLRKRRKRKRCTGVFSRRPPNEIQEQKERRRERERERGEIQ
jgi:hypothetical protein